MSKWLSWYMNKWIVFAAIDGILVVAVVLYFLLT